ncbi:type IX secretion system membrane protein PorP/SprF, partial [bacterium]|nr:type IX secretion system membrane protein PorP/SprF [bacterium]
MKLRCRTLAAVLLLSAVTLSGQDTWYGSVSGMQVMYNPAFAGTGGNQSLKISAFSFLPGKGFGLQSVYASWDGYFSSLHGGAGIWFSDEMLGEIMNDLRAGASYAYHFRAGRETFITAGLTASVITRGLRSGSVILPGDIDPFRGITGGGTEYIPPEPLFRFDLGTGFSLSSGNWYGGASVMHLTRPSLSDDDSDHNRINRLFTLTGGVSLTPGAKDLTLTPSAAIMIQGDGLKFYLGSEASFRGLCGGLSMWHVTDGFTALGGSAGWDVQTLKVMISYS